VIGRLDALVVRLDEVAAELEGVERRVDGSVTWLRSGTEFATKDRSAIEFRLEGAIAAAARHTPEATTSTRGDDWVRFAPSELDQFAVDRAIAWFEAAWRRATASTPEKAR
jgi:hypothetical protein